MPLRTGVGTSLVEVAARETGAAGCEWLHVDFEDHLGRFYFGCWAAVAIRSSAVGRRVLALLAIPACLLIIAVSGLTPAGPVTTGDLELIYLPTLAVLSVVLLASRRHRDRGDLGAAVPHQPDPPGSHSAHGGC